MQLPSAIDKIHKDMHAFPPVFHWHSLLHAVKFVAVSPAFKASMWLIGHFFEVFVYKATPRTRDLICK